MRRQVATASTLEPRVEALLAELFEQDRAKLQTLDAPALLDARLDGIAPDSALLQVPSSRHNHSSDRSAVGLIGTLLAHRAKEAGIDRVRMPVRLCVGLRHRCRCRCRPPPPPPPPLLLRWLCLNAWASVRRSSGVGRELSFGSARCSGLMVGRRWLPDSLPACPLLHLASCVRRVIHVVLLFAGLLIVEPKKADKWDNRVDKSHN